MTLSKASAGFNGMHPPPSNRLPSGAANTTSTYLPAQPGWFVVGIIDEGGPGGWEDWLSKCPVIAWRITEEQFKGDPYNPLIYAEPVCIESIDKNYLLLTPNGEVFDPENCSWETAEAFVRAQKAEAGSRK
jgi:hypothetical protein